MSEPKTYTCERCEHSYTDKYGVYKSYEWGAEWLCDDCINDDGPEGTPYDEALWNKTAPPVDKLAAWQEARLNR